jgi:hypothetical protein
VDLTSDESTNKTATWQEPLSLTEDAPKAQSVSPHFALILTGDGIWPNFVLTVSHHHRSWQLQPASAGDGFELAMGKASS